MTPIAADRVEAVSVAAARPLRWLAVAWKTLALAALAIVGYGLLALLRPEVLVEGFEASTGRDWDGFAATDVEVADFVLLGFRLVGGLNLAVGLLLLAVTVFAFRAGARWAWWTLLVGNTVAYGAPMIYDQAVGSIGPFEIGEYLALAAVYAALAATSPMARHPGPP